MVSSQALSLREFGNVVKGLELFKHFAFRTFSGLELTLAERVVVWIIVTRIVDYGYKRGVSGTCYITLTLTPKLLHN